MNLLAADTSGRTCSAALVSEGRVRAEVFADPDQTHARHLMKLIDAVVHISGTQIGEMDAFAVTAGPGSFTGLRIGLATIKGLALASGKPVVGISAFSALVHPLPRRDGLICAAIDARKGEVYAEVYRAEPQGLTVALPGRAGAPEALAEQVRQLGEPCCFVGSGALLYRDILVRELGGRACIAPGAAGRIRAGTVGELACARIDSGAAQHANELVPYYIRGSDAQKKGSARAGAVK